MQQFSGKVLEIICMYHKKSGIHSNRFVFFLADFSERPTSVNASLGMIAIFRCLPSQGGPGDVVWRVNGTYLNRLYVNDIHTNITTTINGTHNCLYIQASEERNNTVIECVLPDLEDGKVIETSNATLTVQGWF